MARALARGWGEPVLCSDAGSGRARALVAELGGEVLSNAEVAEQADLVVLCHKPRQLQSVASELGARSGPVASVLGAVSASELTAAYPHAPVFRLVPNTPVAVRRGVICYARSPVVAEAVEAEVLAHFGRLGTVVTLEESLIEKASAVMSVGPAYQALLVEAQVDAAVRHGLSAALAARLVVETMTGTAALLQSREHDTLAVRREVTSPGGSTARGLAALEHAGVRAAFQDAIDAATGADA